MKYFFFLMVGLLTVAASCSWNSGGKSVADIAKDTLRYQYKTFKQRAADCGTKPDSGCTVVMFKYPVFPADIALSDTVRHRTATLFGVYKKADTGFRQFADRFMKAYQQDMVNRNTKMIYTLQAQTTIVRQDSALVALQLSGYSFQGGAHGSSLTVFLNWNSKAHKQLRLNDLLIDNYKQPLDSIGEKIFRKQENLSDAEPLKNNYFFAKDKFSLNDNFLVTPTGLRFVYNEYEIKPYAAGKTELFIPYAQIKTLLRVNTVITQYHL
ncbi:DUF3298 domain-containing protein [Mucilaginibacter mali]|uniref:DUF3298 domain-containing protein n=1 Tax=Mucilaginibacter mali TaxID=2740462 RepID=A0A7D4UA75_9SPHI|nr:RsiV family protein [Mucilaginibacter mali]QKJ29698.1 DUF3298 domain-containing protein [Mucilaginibacter mali]